MASKTPPQKPRVTVSMHGRIAKQLRQAALTLTECVEISQHKFGGVLVLKGTRFTLTQLLAQLGDGDSLDDLVENFDLDKEQTSKVLHALAAYLDRPESRAKRSPPGGD